MQNTTGGLSGPYSARNAFRNSSPFITGMFQSSSTQSGICARQASSACWPSPASATVEAVCLQDASRDLAHDAAVIDHKADA